MPAFLTQGLTNIRDAIRGTAGNYITHVGVSDDTVAFSAAQTALNPTAGATANLIKTMTATVVDTVTIDYTMSIDGTTEFTGKVINTIGALKGATRTDAMSRTVRGSGLGIGVQSGDTFTVGVRIIVTDTTP